MCVGGGGLQESRPPSQDQEVVEDTFKKIEVFACQSKVEYWEKIFDKQAWTCEKGVRTTEQAIRIIRNKNFNI